MNICYLVEYMILLNKMNDKISKFLNHYCKLEIKFIYIIIKVLKKILDPVGQDKLHTFKPF